MAVQTGTILDGLGSEVERVKEERKEQKKTPAAHSKQIVRVIINLYLTKFGES
jgi:hypothetical protein